MFEKGQAEDQFKAIIFLMIAVRESPLYCEGLTASLKGNSLHKNIVL
jgi:hypothetical protein